MGHWPGSFMRLARSLSAVADDSTAQQAQRTIGTWFSKRVRPRTNICKDLHGSDDAVRRCRPVTDVQTFRLPLVPKTTIDEGYLTTFPDTPAPRSTAIWSSLPLHLGWPNPDGLLPSG